MKTISLLHIDYDDLQNSFGSGGQAVLTSHLYQKCKNMKVTILTGNYPGAKDKIQHNVTYKRLGIGNMGPSISLLSYWFIVPFAAFFMQKNCDIIVEFFTAPFSVSFVFLFARKPHVAFPTFLGAKNLSQKYKLPFTLFEKFGVKHIKYFFVPSIYMAKQIKAYNPSAYIYALSYGYDAELKKVKTAEKNYILFLGRIDIFNKSLDIVIKGWKDISKKYPNVRLYIAGSGKKQDEIYLSHLIAKYQLVNFIKMLGYINGKRKKRLLANCLFTISPSRYETFGLSALESLAAGKPVITSNIPGFSWIPPRIRLQYQTNDYKDFSRVCISLIKDKAKRKEIAKKAKAFVKTKSWEKVSKQYQNLITNFLYEFPITYEL